MNSKILPARLMCTRCQNIESINAEHCSACGASFVFGKEDAWKSTSFFPLKKQRPDNINDLARTGMITIPCLWDSVSEEDKRKGMYMSCPCPKCTTYC